MIEEVYFVLLGKGYRPVKVCKNASEAFAHGELHISSFDENGEHLHTYTRVTEIGEERFADETDYKVVEF